MVTKKEIKKMEQVIEQLVFHLISFFVFKEIAKLLLKKWCIKTKIHKKKQQKHKVI